MGMREKKKLLGKDMDSRLRGNDNLPKIGKNETCHPGLDPGSMFSDILVRPINSNSQTPISIL